MSDREEALRLARAWRDPEADEGSRSAGSVSVLARALLDCEREAGTWKASREIWVEEATTAVARAEAAERDLATAREALADFDHALSMWEQAYPTEVFGESLSEAESAQVVAALREAGFTSERVHASWARHVVGCIAGSFAALRSLDRENDIERLESSPGVC